MRTEALTTIILYAFVGLMIFGIAQFIIPEKELIYQLFNFFYSAGILAGLALFFIETDLRQSSFLKFIVIGLVILLLGVLLPYIHLQLSLILILSGSLTIIVSYFLRFYMKCKKRFLDYIKVLWLISFVIGLCFELLHLPYSDILLDGASVIIWIGLVGMLYQKKNHQPKDINE